MVHIIQLKVVCVFFFFIKVFNKNQSNLFLAFF
jgi:hypothetical protein